MEVAGFRLQGHMGFDVDIYEAPGSEPPRPQQEQAKRDKN